MLSLYLAVIEDHRDDSKFEELYYKYRNMMFSVSFKILKNETLAEDALQEAFFSVARNIKKIKNENDDMTRSYLFIVIKNASYKVYNREMKNRVINIDTLSNVFDKYDLYESVSSDENYRKIIEYILSLPEIYRDVLSLYYIQGMNTKEISEALGIKADTAKRRLQRGKKQLADKMKEIYDDK